MRYHTEVMAVLSDTAGRNRYEPDTAYQRKSTGKLKKAQLFGYQLLVVFWRLGRFQER